MYDVYGSLSKPLPSSFKIAQAVMLFPYRDNRPKEQTYQIKSSKHGIYLCYGNDFSLSA
jgi:hypothetical protein